MENKGTASKYLGKLALQMSQCPS